MKNKKHIDQLFKERFEQFEPTPSPHVWQQIEAKMKKEKEDRKVIPIWWKVAGVAALLALLFTIGNSVFNSDAVNTEIVDTNTETPTDKVVDQNEIANEALTQEATPLEKIDNSETQIDEGLVKSNQTQQKSVTNNKGVQTAVAVEHTSEKTTQKHSTPQNQKTGDAKQTLSNQRDAVATQETTKQLEKNKNLNEQFVQDAIIPSENKKEAVAVSEEKNTSGKVNSTSPLIKTEAGVKNTENAVAKNEKNKKANKVNSETSTEVPENKKSIFDAINEANTTTTEEAVAKTNTPDKRWDVSPNFAPVYYSSLDGGSSIDPSFADNSKNSDVNFSYGVQVSYNINDRLSLRSGVSNVDLSYGTGGIEIVEGPVSSALRTIDYGGRSVVTSAADKGAFSMPGDSEYPNVNLKSTSADAEIIQNISYYEVPLELKYAVLNNKFGVNLIGGFSTLFLGNNEVSVSAQDFNSVLGEANNLSTVSFTTNVGVGFDYKLSSKFKFNIEPMFKYQLNPYTDSSVGFKPYYVGVYTGLSLSF